MPALALGGRAAVAEDVEAGVVDDADRCWSSSD
jgi:hypothetical protein